MKSRFPQLETKRDCTGCMACVDSCAQHAISSYRDEDGHVYVRLDSDRCVGCLKCEKVCLGRDNYQGSNQLAKSFPFAAWTKDSILRKQSTSGGVFASVAKKVLLEGGVVVGASFDGRYGKHIVIERCEDLGKLQGSKYVQSSTEGIFEEIKHYLPDKKVLFSGVGCQVAAVLSYFANSKHKDNLYTLDLICGGVPSDLLMEKYFDMKKGLNSITSFRTKRKYELKGVVDGIEQELGCGALPISGFAAELTNRFSCYHCQYAFAHRKSDITIGDLWGSVGFENERNEGISLAIAHNERGYSLMKDSEIEAHMIRWKDFLQYNARLVIGDMPLPILRRWLPRNAKVMRIDIFAKAYSSSANYSHPLLFVDRCIRAVVNRTYNYFTRKKINRILSQ